MTTSNLVSKLNKMNIANEILDVNGYNKDIKFIINGMTFKAGYTEGKTVIEDLCREICFDNNTQEMQRRFFGSFNQLLKYANAKI